MNESCGKVLVVGEDYRATKRLTSILEHEGYEVESADNPELAFTSVAARPPHLILLDMGSPGLGGAEMCRRFKETEHGQRVPIILVSPSKERLDLAEGLTWGAVDFVSTPTRREELLARVRTHVELHRLRAEMEMRVAPRIAESDIAIERRKVEVFDRRRSELALRESETRFRQLANAAPVIIWTSDQNNNVDFCNAYAQEFAGKSKKKIKIKHWAKIIHPDDLENQRLTYRQNMAALKEFQLEYRICRADGEYRWMLEKGTPRFLPKGEFAGYVGIAIDLTDIKNSLERVLAARNLENLRVLAAAIAHDFNTLLSAVLGEADLALSDLPYDVPERDNIERIVALAKRSGEIMRLLLVYVGDPSASAAPELVDINSVVEELVPHLKMSVSRQAEIRVNLAPKLPSVLAKTLEIRQVVLNLILNALEALGAEKGMVTITTHFDELAADSPDCSLSSLTAGGYVRLVVSDSGRGIGRGWEMAAVQDIIRANGGAITLRSASGKGSSFEVLLPIAANPDLACRVAGATN
jgi:PAS domain S-box-containing protein